MPESTRPGLTISRLIVINLPANSDNTVFWSIVIQAELRSIEFMLVIARWRTMKREGSVRLIRIVICFMPLILTSLLEAQDPVAQHEALLRDAIFADNVNRIRVLLRTPYVAINEELSLKGFAGYTPLEVAAVACKLGAYRYLKLAGDKVRPRAEILQKTIELSCYDVAEDYVNAGADARQIPIGRSNVPFIHTVLMQSAKDSRGLELLLKAHADPNTRWPPPVPVPRGIANSVLITWVAGNGDYRLPAIRLLITYGADVNITNYKGYRAIDYATAKCGPFTSAGRAELIKMLKDAGSVGTRVTPATECWTVMRMDQPG